MHIKMKYTEEIKHCQGKEEGQSYTHRRYASIIIQCVTNTKKKNAITPGDDEETTFG